jgi:hypothetical protein
MKSLRSRRLSGAQGYGGAMRNQSHDYKRHGTTRLFAALEVATGKVMGPLQNGAAASSSSALRTASSQLPDRELHVILGNLNTHKKDERWLKKHPNVQSHFTPRRFSGD